MSNQYLSFDVTKQSAPQQLITGRQGDSQLKFTSVLLWDGDKNIPYDLTGKQIAFEALKPDGTHIVDYAGITILDAPHGLFRYSFNEQVFAVAGTMQQAFFKITHTDKDDQVITDSTLEINIHILENRVEFGINSTDYLSEYDDLIVKVKNKFDDYAATVQKSIDEAKALRQEIDSYIKLIEKKQVLLFSDTGKKANNKAIVETYSEKEDGKQTVVYPQTHVSAVLGIDDDKTYGSDGYLRESTVLKNDLDLTPYDVVEGTVDLVEGDYLTEENVNRMYNALSVEKIYSLYDALVNQNKRMRHAEQWGTVGDLPFKWYHFEPENRFLVPADSQGESNFDKYNRLNGSKPMLFITSGIHGDEKSNVWALYLTIRGIANGETELDRYLRRNYEIVVLPCVNPYGLENNQRHNENDVDINRNFPYTWDEDTNQWKGTAPFSEQSSRFVQEIRDKFLSENSLGYKQGMLFIDSHDFNFKNNDDERIMWTGATNGLVRNSLLKTGGLVKDKITSLYPKLVTGEGQNFFALLGSGNGYGATLNAWNNSCGIKSISMESPDYLTILGVNDRYSIQSSTISYMLVRDFILQSTLDLSGKAAPDVTVGFSNAMSTEEDDLLDILHNIPSGKTFVTGVYSHTSKLSQQMPKRPDGINYLGVLKATKSNASTSHSGTVEFTTTGFKTTHKFFSSFNIDGVRKWQEVQPAKLFTTFTSLNLSNKSASLLDVFNRLPNGSTADLYIQPGINMHNDLPDGVTNYAKIRISRNTSNTGFVELFSFKSVNRMYVMNISLGQKTEWTNFTRGTYLTSFISFGGSANTTRLLKVFERLEVGQIADLYIQPTTELRKDLPERFNTDYGSIKIRKLSDIMGRVEAMTSGETGRRMFTNVINSNGLGTWFELNDGPAN